MRHNITVTRFVLGFALAGAATACGGDSGTPEGDPAAGEAFLSIVGDSALTLDASTQTTLRVRYHDAEDLPLAGDVEFAIVGDGRDAQLSSAMVTTDADGVAAVELSSSSDVASFRVAASVGDARAEWSISVDLEAVPRDASGTYEVDSVFDVVTNMPGSAGNVLGTIVEMTDDPYDPATWLIDTIDNPTLNTFKGIIEPLLYQLIQSQAPDLAQDLLLMGNHLGDITRELGLVSELEVARGSNVEQEPYTANHTVYGFALEVDGVRTVYLLQELGDDTQAISNIGFGFAEDTGRIDIGEHSVHVPYGGLLALALEDVVIPMVDPNAGDLQELLENAVDCASFGADVADALGFGSPGTYQAICQSGLAAASSALLDQLRAIDERAPVILQIHGDAMARDTSGDGLVDSLDRGTWMGLINYNGQVADLPDGVNSFVGERMSN